jgi:hypothetical protein
LCVPLTPRLKPTAIELQDSILIKFITENLQIR